MKEFFAMGGYAFYVWMSYGIALVVLVANLIGPLMQRRRLLGDIARRQRRLMAPDEGLIERSQLGRQHAGRPAIVGNVVNRERQHILLRCQPV